MIELKTVTENKLNTLETTNNFTNFHDSSNSVEKSDFIRNAYKTFFEHFLEVSKKPNIDFAGSLLRECNSFCRSLEKELNTKFGVSKVAEKGKVSDVTKITHKFRGNIGEITAEYFFKVFGISIVDDYKPIAVENDLESFNDGEGFALSPDDSYPVWVQVKMQNRELKSDVIWKMDHLQNMYLKKHLDTNLEIFYSKKRAVLFTFSDLGGKGSKLREEYLEVTQIIGPSEINRFFGNSKDGNWTTFCNVVLKNM